LKEVDNLTHKLEEDLRKAEHDNHDLNDEIADLNEKLIKA